VADRARRRAALLGAPATLTIGEPADEGTSAVSETDEFTTNDGYDWRYFALIGRLVVTWSRVEGLLKQLIVDIVAGDEWTIHSLSADMPAARLIERCRAISEQLVVQPDRDLIHEWLNLADQARVTRNQALHGHWIAIYLGYRWAPAQLSIRVKSGGRLSVGNEQIPIDLIERWLDEVSECLRAWNSLPASFRQSPRPIPGPSPIA